MAISLPSLETVTVVWNWGSRNFDTWAKVLRSPHAVARELDLSSPETLLYALQFSAFCVLLAMAVDFPAYVMYGIDLVTPMKAAADFALYYLSMMLFAGAQRFAAIIVRGHGSMRPTFIATLIASAFLPILNIADYLQLANPRVLGELIEHTFSSDVYVATLNAIQENPRLGISVIVEWALVFYVLVKLVPLTKHVHKVGSIRATTICLITLAMGGLAVAILLQPVAIAMFAPHPQM